MLNLSLDIKLQPKQYEALSRLEHSLCQYLAYGGAKGGGKSYLVRAAMVYRRIKYAGTSGVIVRQTYPELVNNHIRKFFTEYPFLKEFYRAGDKSIHFPNGSYIDFRHLASTDDVYNYQGIEYDDIFLDEATQHDEEVFKILKTSLRSDPVIRTKYPNYRPKFLLTCNPGGKGHGWVQRLFIDREFSPNETPEDYEFIQAKIYDNPLLIQTNPEYLKNLMDLPEDMRKAYLEGDWHIFSGQYFKKLRYHVHVVEDFYINPDWVRFRSLDWGYNHNSVCLWWAIDWKGNAYIYRCYKKSGVVASQMARNIIEMTPREENIILTVASPDLWARIRHDELPSVETMADIVMQNGLYIEKAVHDRVAGWQALREMIEWDEKRKPRLYIFKSCDIVFKDLCKLIHDDTNPEDVKKMINDDVGDAARYGAMHIFKSEAPPKHKSEIEAYIDKITKPREEFTNVYDTV